MIFNLNPTLVKSLKSLSTMAEAKSRIIHHMNHAHQLALKDYLVAYGKRDLSSISEESIGISDVTDKSLTIGYQTVDGTNSTFEIYWDDAIEDQRLEVSSYSDIKPKLVAMAKYAAKVQGFSHVRITTATPPGKVALPMYLMFIVLTMEVLAKGSVRSLVNSVQLLSYLASLAPSASLKTFEFLEQYATLLFSLVYTIHIGEVVFVTLPNVHKYRVPFKQGLIWVLMNFVEGFFVFWRFNELKQ